MIYILGHTNHHMNMRLTIYRSLHVEVIHGLVTEQSSMEILEQSFHDKYSMIYILETPDDSNTLKLCSIPLNGNKLIVVT